MKRFFVFLFLFLLGGCGDFDIGGPTVCRENVYHDYSVKGDFLLDHGERIVFTPKCYYEKSYPKLRCGLAVLGVETRKVIRYSTYGMDCPSTEETARFDYSSTDFSKVIVVTSKDSSKSILSYSHILSKDEFTLNHYFTYYNDKVLSLTALQGVDSLPVQLDLIESDSLGVVDFSLKDVNGTRVYMRFDLSPDINYWNSGVTSSDSGITLLFDWDYKFLDAECNMREFQFCHYCRDSDSVTKNIITNDQMKTCLKANPESDDEISLGVLPSLFLEYANEYRNSMLACESEPEIQINVSHTFDDDLEDDLCRRCKSLRVVFYGDTLFYKE